MRFPRLLSSLRLQMLLVVLVAIEFALWLYLEGESARKMNYLDPWSEATIPLLVLNLLIFVPAGVRLWAIRSRVVTSGKNRVNDGSILHASDRTPGT